MIECICDHCGEIVRKYPSQVKNRVFCNKECCDLDRKERVNALKAINTVFKDIINGDCNNLKGEDLNNLVEALNKL